jgi:hypothetical protein
MTSRCPICGGKPAPERPLSLGPFCSRRCKTIDLGQWLGEGYRIPDERAEDTASESELPS